MKKFDWMAGAALAMAIVGTASAEYNLAVAAGWGQVAFALPGCLDIYALRALRAHRDLLSVLVVLIVVNSVSHLIAVGLLAPSVWVVIGVSSIAPAVLWRVHALRDAASEPEAEPMDDHFRTAAELTEVPAEPSPVPVTIERVPEVEPQGSRGIQPLTFGPLISVAELLAGTSRDQGDRVPLAGTNGAPEPAESEAEPQDGSDLVPETAFDADVATAYDWLASDPTLTGTQIGTKLGKSDSYGRRVRRAALAVSR